MNETERCCARTTLSQASDALAARDFETTGDILHQLQNVDLCSTCTAKHNDLMVRLCIRTGRFSQAEPWILRLEQRGQDCSLFRVSVMLGQEDMNGAYTLLRRILDDLALTHPIRGTLLETMAAILVFLERCDEAWDYLVQARRQTGKPMDLRQLIISARIRLGQGDLSRAEAYLERAEESVMCTDHVPGPLLIELVDTRLYLLELQDAPAIDRIEWRERLFDLTVIYLAPGHPEVWRSFYRFFDDLCEAKGQTSEALHDARRCLSRLRPGDDIQDMTEIVEELALMVENLESPE